MIGRSESGGLDVNIICDSSAASPVSVPRRGPRRSVTARDSVAAAAPRFPAGESDRDATFTPARAPAGGAADSDLEPGSLVTVRVGLHESRSLSRASRWLHAS